MPDQSALLDDISDMLLNNPLLSSLPATEIKSAARYFNISEIAQDEVIFKEGDIGNFFCIIIDGTVSVQKANQDDENVELAKLPKGRTIGEMAVLDGERRSATCIAATDCTLLLLSKDALERMMLDAPRTAAKVIRAIAISLSRRLRMADGKMVDSPMFNSAIDFQL
jgi:CRP-like cAMP-binding protein